MGGAMPQNGNAPAAMAPYANRPLGGGPGPQIPPGMTRGVQAGAGMAGMGNAAPTMGTQPVQSAQPTVDPRRLAGILASMGGTR